VIERICHHNLDKFAYSVFQRIRYASAEFSPKIVIIDTSPIFNVTAMQTNRWALADLLKTVQMGNPNSVGVDVFFQIDSITSDPEADQYLKTALSEYKHIVLPHPVDPFFMVGDSVSEGNVYLYDGYSTPLQISGNQSLPFQMATDTGWIYRDPFYFQYAADNFSLREKHLVVSGMDILSIWTDPELTEEDKVDELSLLFDGRSVLIGFCHPLIYVMIIKGGH